MPKSSSNLTAPVLSIEGTEKSTVALNASVFGVETNESLVSEVIVSAQSNRRHAIANALTRGEIRGGGRKPWKQKGTGRARAGSTRSPIWRHGGVVFGPSKERNFTRKINQKARYAVVRMLLSTLVATNAVRVVEYLNGASVSTTKKAAALLNSIAGEAKKPMLVTATTDAALLKSFRNLPGVMVRSLERLGLLDLVATDLLILDSKALEAVGARYATAKREQAPVAETTEAPAKKVARKTTKKVTETVEEKSEVANA